ncbi:MAG: FAD binding domain-containing protein [Thermovirgaceae bacterium]
MRASRPRDLSELRKILGSGEPDLKFLAGGTDLVVHLNANPGEDWNLVDLTGIKELKRIAVEGPFLEIGALATFQDLEDSQLVRSKTAGLAEAAAMVGSCQIRNRGTLGGNVANGSAAADIPPVLCALNALLVIESCDGNQRRVRAEEANPNDFKSLAARGEFIRKFLVPLEESDLSFFDKVGSRRAVTISKLNLAFSCKLQRSRIENPRLFLGALAPWPVRAVEAESLLTSVTSKDLAETSFLDALSKTVEKTIPDRASMPYKRQAVKGLGSHLWARLLEVIL